MKMLEIENLMGSHHYQIIQKQSYLVLSKNNLILLVFEVSRY